MRRTIALRVRQNQNQQRGGSDDRQHPTTEPVQARRRRSGVGGGRGGARPIQGGGPGGLHQPAAHGAGPRQADRRHRLDQSAVAFRGRQGPTHRHGHRHGAHPRQGPVRRRDQGRIRPAGGRCAHPQHHHRQGRRRDPVHDRLAGARPAGGVLPPLLRRGRGAADWRRNRNGSPTRTSRPPGSRRGSRCCRTSMPTRWCTMRCRTRR